MVENTSNDSNIEYLKTSKLKVKFLDNKEKSLKSI